MRQNRSIFAIAASALLAGCFLAIAIGLKSAGSEHEHTISQQAGVEDARAHGDTTRPVPSSGQIIDPTRSIDWSQAGVVGGIPSGSWAQCGSTIAAGATVATINAAIRKCAANHFILLGAGTFNLTSGIVMKSGVALRGLGADQTILVFSGADPCGGTWSAVCFFGGDSSDWSGSSQVQPGGSKAASWIAGYARGATQIVLDNIGSNGIRVGQYIYLDQDNDTATNGGLFVCENPNANPPCSVEGGAGNPGRVVEGIARQQVQIVKATSCSPACTSGATFTISPGLYASNWNASKKPGVWWSKITIENAGVEDLTIDSTNSKGQIGVAMFNAANVWVTGTRNIRTCKCKRSIIQMASATHVTIQDNYFYGTSGHFTNYGVESYISSDNLIVNNIFHHVVSPLLLHSNQGSVYAYNYAINNTYDDGRRPSYRWLSLMATGHSGGVMYNLLEGNVGPGIGGDYFHGNQVMNTVFRNYLLGSDPNRIENTFAIRVDAWNRYWNVVGNVLGTPGYTSTYSGPNAAVYALGRGNSALPHDPLVARTMMRWGNYDTVHGSTQWNTSEVPSAVGAYSSAVPSTRILPASLFYSSKPSWWPAGKPWPAIGPDVSGGNIPGVAGHAHTIPAQDCYTSMDGPADGSGNILNFDASTCYRVMRR